MILRASAFLAFCILICAGDTNAAPSGDSSLMSFLVKQAARCQKRYDADQIAHKAAIRELNITLTSKIAKLNDDLAAREKTVVGLTTRLQAETAAKNRALQELQAVSNDLAAKKETIVGLTTEVAGLTSRLQAETAARNRALQDLREKNCRGESCYLSHHPYIDGGGWKLVRRVSPKDNHWHPATDGLRGTQVYGSFVDQPTYQGTFSRRFDWNRVQDFLFATGDGSQWMVASRDQVNGADYNVAQRLVKMSSTMRYAHYSTFGYSSIYKHNPLITIKNTGVVNWSGGQTIYLGNSHPGYNPPSDRNGANVFVRYR